MTGWSYIDFNIVDVTHLFINVDVIAIKETLLFQKSKTNYWMKGMKNQVDEEEMILDKWYGFNWKTDNAVCNLYTVI